MPVFIGIAVIAVLVLVLTAVREVIHLVSVYPIEFWLFVSAVLFLAVGTGAALHRVNGRQVTLRPAAPKAPPPLSRAIRAVPVLTAVAAGNDDGARDCEGPECRNKVDGDPYVARVHGEGEHVFCSVPCMRQWSAACQPHAVAKIDDIYG